MNLFTEINRYTDAYNKWIPRRERVEWTRDWDRPIYTTTYIKEKAVKSSHSVMSDSATPWTVAY